jgi:hypothetical protein
MLMDQEGRCPRCGGVVVMSEGVVACHHCHELISAEEVRRAGQRIEYFGSGGRGEERAFTSKAAIVGMEFVAGAVALGIAAGLTEPGPVLRRLAACGVFLGGIVGAGFGLAATRRRLGSVDRSLAVTSVAMGLLCMAAGVVIWIGRVGR